MPVHICFVALAAWPLLAGDRSIETVGGAEAHQVELAKVLVRAGHRVTMICMDYGQPDGVVVEGVRVLKAHTPAGGLPVLRFVHPRFTSVWRALARADAQIYYQRGAGIATGYAAAFCRTKRRRFIYAAASDADFDPKLPSIRYARDRAIYRWGLRRAERLLVQNPTQQSACIAMTDAPVALVRNCLVPPHTARRDRAGYVLWVSTMRRLKQPEMVVELARRMPDLRFVVVGGPDESGYQAAIHRSAEGLCNLEFRGFVPYADIATQFDGARVLINTSKWEGFPNTFLHAWARGIPAISFFDPGAMLDGEPVTCVARGLDDMQTQLRKLMDDECAWSIAGARCSRYFEQEYSATAVLRQHEAIFEGLQTESPNSVDPSQADEQKFSRGTTTRQ